MVSTPATGGLSVAALAPAIAIAIAGVAEAGISLSIVAATAENIPDDIKKFYNLKDSIINIDDKQFGKKVGKHAEDFNLNPNNPENRKFIKDKIHEIFNNATEIRQGEWRGKGKKLLNGSHESGQVKFYILGNDVVITDLNNKFVTIMKDDINNLRVQDAIKIWP